MNLFVKQVENLRLKIVTKPKTYVLWNNTEEGRDMDDCYERVEENGCVEYINTNNVDMRVIQGDNFFNALEELYNLALVNEAQRPS
jgi:hypothetical protein